MSQWFFLHSIANLFVVVGAVPDFYFASFRPASSLSVAFCASSSLPAYACSDWPTCIIVGKYNDAIGQTSETDCLRLYLKQQRHPLLFRTVK